jgi:UDP:flavonoid glycosyltransferase YjiC (YdhE family)
MVLIPIMAEQAMNAERCAALSVGIVLDLKQLTPQAAREAVLRVMNDPSFHENAMRVRAESESLPGPEEAVKLLERLAAQREPLPASSQ